LVNVVRQDADGNDGAASASAVLPPMLDIRMSICDALFNRIRFFFYSGLSV
jgi:hypothetical protein